MGKGLHEATLADFRELAKSLREKLSGPQTANILRMFVHSLNRPDEKEVLRVLALKQRVKRLSPDDILLPVEVQRIVAAARTLRDKAFIATLYETGVRVHEVLALSVGDVSVHPENGSGKTIYRLWFKKVKVASETHYGFLTESVPIFEAWWKVVGHSPPESPLFPTKTGKRIYQSGCLRMLKGAAADAGITKRVWLHGLRHARATHLRAGGVPDSVIAKLLGWRTTAMLDRTYGHLNAEASLNALLKAQGVNVPDSDQMEKIDFKAAMTDIVTPAPAPAPVSEKALEARVEARVQAWLEAKLPGIMRAVVEGVELAKDTPSEKEMEEAEEAAHQTEGRQPKKESA